MRTIWVIALREFVQAVFTKAFLFGVLFAPALMTLAILLPKYLEKVEEKGERVIAVVDLSAAVLPDLEVQAEQSSAEDQSTTFVLEDHAVDPGDAEFARGEPSFETLVRLKSELGERVRAGEIFAFLIIGPRVLDLDPPDAFFDEPDLEDAAAKAAWEREVWPFTVLYGTQSLTDLKTSRFLRSNVNDIVQRKRYAATGIDPSVVQRISRPVKIQEFKVQKERTEAEDQGVVRASGERELVLPIGFLILLYIAVMTSAAPLLNNTIEEKSNRILEVMLSASTPFRILTGKILGNSMMGLTLTVIWGVAAVAAAMYHGLLPAGGIPLSNVAYFLFFFVTGYLVFGCLYAAIGSLCMTVQEAQSMMAPLIAVLIIPMVAIQHVIENPSSLISVVLSYFPFSAPFVMMLRLGLSPEPPPSQVALSMAGMLASVAVLLWAAGKVFRIAILMYGKPPSMRQLWGWIRSH